MTILGISCSPHKDGPTARLTREAVKGAREAGADTEIILLPEKKIQPCIACGGSCWETMECTLSDDGISIRRKMNEADGLIVSAPVYFLSVNGLAKNFMDRMRYYGESGKPALAISVAGGTGKGCTTALKDICLWLVMLGFRPHTPLPVTRYDMDIALVEARQRGKRLAVEFAERRPFEGLAERIAWYESLPFMHFSIADEIAHLADVAIDGISRRGRSALASKSRSMLEKTKALHSMERTNEELKQTVAAHENSMAIFDGMQRDGSAYGISLEKNPSDNLGIRNTCKQRAFKFQKHIT